MHFPILSLSLSLFLCTHGIAMVVSGHTVIHIFVDLLHQSDEIALPCASVEWSRLAIDRSAMHFRASWICMAAYCQHISFFVFVLHESFLLHLLNTNFQMPFYCMSYKWVVEIFTQLYFHSLTRMIRSIRHSQSAMSRANQTGRLLTLLTHLNQKLLNYKKG